jgi:hypothetical protein
MRHTAAAHWITEDGATDGAEPPRPWRTTLAGRVPPNSDAPVCAALADQWRSAGRMVPGQADREWSELVGRVPGRTGR